VPFLRGATVSESFAGLEALEPFIDQGLVSEVLFQVKSGKEAVVWCCRGGTAALASGGTAALASGGTACDRPLLAAKVYRPLERRLFRRDADYFEGRVILGGRNRRAFAAKTDHGRAVQMGYWTAGEWEALTSLHAAGTDVPEPIARSNGAMLMEYLGDDDGPAPQLVHVRLGGPEAQEAYERVLWNVERFLEQDRVHGDLSAHNVLWWEGRVRVIDFPQSVDARMSPRAREYLMRDLEHVDCYFRSCGVRVRGEEFGEAVWRRFEMGEIG